MHRPGVFLMAGLLFGKCSKCCPDDVCGECAYPRFLSVTIAGFPDGYAWASGNGGQPPVGGGFDPACGEGSDAGDPQIQFGGVSAGTSRYLYSFKLSGFNQTFTAEYVEESGCECPEWYGVIETPKTSGAASQPGDECSVEYIGFLIRLCQQESFVTLEIDPPLDQPGETATATVTEVTGGAITDTLLTGGGSVYAYLEVIRSAPTLSVQVNSTDGEDAAFSITLAETTDDNGDPVWTISGITVTNAGTDYEIGDTAEIVVTDGETDWAAWVSLNLTRTEPTVSASVNTSTGSGADLAVVLSSYTDGNGDEVWYVDSITVVNGGTGYDPADTVTISVSVGTEVSSASATLSVVAGVVDSVTVDSYGEYAHTDGTVAGITVQDGGQYYKETVTDNVIVNTPAVHIISNTGSGGQITAVVDDDPDSPTFGEVVSLTIDNGGIKYAIDGPSWYLTFTVAPAASYTILPLAGPTYHFPVFEFAPPGFICAGSDQSSAAEPVSDRVQLRFDEDDVEISPCGIELLTGTYDAFFAASVSSAVNMSGGASYSLGGSSCRDLRVVDFGEGPLTVAISPA